MVKKSLPFLTLFLLAFGACKKGAHNPFAKATPAPQATPTPVIAAATPKPTPAPKPKFQLDQSSRVIVFCYHILTDKIKHPDTEITPRQFEEQMQKLKDAGITVIPMQDFLAWRRGQKNIPAKSAVITLDDGWKSQYEVAWPILKKYGYPFTLFIYPGFVKGGHYAGGQSLSWEQLAEMRDAGVDIQGHSYSHQSLRKKPAGTGRNAHLAQFATYEDWLRYEIVESKKVLEEHLGIKVNVLAVPYGQSNKQVEEMAMKNGYEAVFTVNPVVINFTSRMESLGRYAIENNKPQVFAQAISFPGAASTGFAATAASSPLVTEPADGATISDGKLPLKADLSSFGDVEAKSVEMRVSGYGLVPVKFDPATKIATAQLNEKLRDGEYTVIVSAKSGTRKMESRWSFTVDSSAKPGTTPATSKPAKPAVDVVGS